MGSLGIPHPDKDQLLRFADGELSSGEAREVRDHLSACWECRSEIEQAAKTIAACIHYRKAVLETCLPPPPQPWFDIRREMERANTAGERRIQRLQPRRWIPAGAIAAAAVVAFFYLHEAPSARAAELLKRAAAAAESRPAPQRRIRIRTKAATFVRTIKLVPAPARTPEAGSPAGLEAAFKAAHYSWEDPLSAAAYSSWRDQLRDKTDQVTAEPGVFQIRTTTIEGDLAEARLKLRASDLRAVEGTLRFRNDEWVELSELPEEPLAEAAAAPPARTANDPDTIKPAAPHGATAADELAVFAALHRLGADLGDPVEVTRDADTIVVSGAGLPEDRRKEIRAELGGLPRVSVRFDDPAAGATLPEPAAPSTAPPTAMRSNTELERRLGGRAAYDQFVDRVLDGTDAMMARVHALRRLANRFPSDTETKLRAADRALLRRVAAEHATALARSVAELENTFKPVLHSRSERQGKAQSQAESWQAATVALFPVARRADSLVVDMLGGTGGFAQPRAQPEEILAALDQVRAFAESYGRLTTDR